VQQLAFLLMQVGISVTAVNKTMLGTLGHQKACQEAVSSILGHEKVNPPEASSAAVGLVPEVAHKRPIHHTSTQLGCLPE
jgi:hypothetical protein